MATPHKLWISLSRKLGSRISKTLTQLRVLFRIFLNSLLSMNFKTNKKEIINRVNYCTNFIVRLQIVYTGLNYLSIPYKLNIQDIAPRRFHCRLMMPVNIKNHKLHFKYSS